MGNLAISTVPSTGVEVGDNFPVGASTPLGIIASLNETATGTTPPVAVIKGIFMALYTELPVYKDSYQLVIKGNQGLSTNTLPEYKA